MLHTHSTRLLILPLLLAAPTWADDVTVTLPASDGFVVQNNTASIERLRVDESTGNISRNGALFVHTTGSRNTFVGVSAGNTSTSDYGRNSAFGANALYAVTDGAANSAFGFSALLSTTLGTSNSAFGFKAMSFNTTGSLNAAFGASALSRNMTGSYNSAFGVAALTFNTTGYSNAALGNLALSRNTAGFSNAALGASALHENIVGNFNTAVGYRTLYDNISGTQNVAVGNRALESNDSGSGNIAIGSNAGGNQTSGDSNIYIGNEGVAAENGQIRIGNTTDHVQATIAGIHGNTVPTGIAVLVDSTGLLGTTTSSARFKEAVENLGDDSSVLETLRPVKFYYKEDTEEFRQYGLIAEEVAEVAPELVVYDKEGQPYSVRYHLLAPMLLNEMQKQQQTIEAQATVLEAQSSDITLLQEQVAKLDRGLASQGLRAWWGQQLAWSRAPRAVFLHASIKEDHDDQIRREKDPQFVSDLSPGD